MLCPNCGTRLAPSQTDCHFCGYHISEQTIAMQLVAIQNIANQTVATSQSNSIPITSDKNDSIPTVRNDDNSKNISLAALALFVSMFAFITAFANFHYQSTGESYSVSNANLTSNVTTTIYYPKIYIIAGFAIEGWVLSFLMAIFAFVVATVTWYLLMHFSKKTSFDDAINKIKTWIQNLTHR